MSSRSDSSGSSYGDSVSVNFAGQLLDKKYLLIETIGSGAFAVVWLAFDIFNNKYFAIKMQDPDYYTYGIEEVNILKKISSGSGENLNKMLDYFVHNDGDEYVCMVFELLAGSVYDIMKYNKYRDGFPVEVVKRIIRQLLKSMDTINTKYGILHTDIKPENILVVGLNNKIADMIDLFQGSRVMTLIKTLPNKIRRKESYKGIIERIKDQICDLNFEAIKEKYRGGSSILINDKYIDNIVIKLSDFGSCRKIDYTGFDIQTRYYRSPEIILGYRYNFNCDVWSVGCMIYELLVGKPLFDPKKDERCSTDRNHVKDMVCLLGRIPEGLVNDCEKKELFFRSDGFLKGIEALEYRPLYKLIIRKLEGKIKRDEIPLLIDLLYKTLHYDPFLRPAPGTVMSHNWLTIS